MEEVDEALAALTALQEQPEREYVELKDIPAQVEKIRARQAALQPSPAREEAEALVKRLRQRALARISLKTARAQDYADAHLDNDAAALIAREILGEKP